MTFDMKGSTYKRFSNVGKFWRQSLDQKKVLKDMNYMAITQDIGKRVMDLNCDQSTKLVKIAEADSDFLCKHGLMDYSLLLVIETKCYTDDSEITSRSSEASTRISRSSEGGTRSSGANSMIGSETFNPHMVSKVKKGGSKQIYHMGIIDYLQVWDSSKKIERLAKTVTKPSIYNKLSAVPPE